MEFTKDSGIQGRWIPATPAKLIPAKSPLPAMSGRNRAVDSGGASGITSRTPERGQTAALASASQGQMGGRPYLVRGRIGDGVGRSSGGGGRQEMIAESSNQNKLLLKGKFLLLPNRENGGGRLLRPLAPKPQYMSEYPFLDLNSSPENNMASTVAGQAMPPPATPAAVVKHQCHRQRARDCPPHEIIDLDPEIPSFEDRLHDRLAENHVDKCFSNQVESSQIGNSQQQEGWINVAISSSEGRALQQDGGENQGIDLNKTPPQKPKRKKHRPKVIREGKPARTPKPATPNLPKTTESPSGKRKYAAKKKDMSMYEPPAKPQDTPSSAGSGEAVDQDIRSRNNSVRRSLNFDLDDSQVVDRLSGSASMMSRQNVVGCQGQEGSTVENAVNQSSSGVHCSQGQDPVALGKSTGCGNGFDLNCSSNQFGNKSVRDPQSPNQPPCPGQEMRRKKWLHNFERMIHDMNTYPRSEGGERVNTTKKLAKRTGCQNIPGSLDRHSEYHQRQVVANTSSDSLLQREQKGDNLVDDAQVSANISFMHANGSGRLSGTYTESSADAGFLDIHKRRRLDNNRSEAIHNVSSMSPIGGRTIHNTLNANKVFTIGDEQRLMAFENCQAFKLMLDCNQGDMGTDDGRIQDNRPMPTPTKLPVRNNMNCMRPQTPDKAPGYRNCPETDRYGPQTRVEIIIAKQKKTIPRSRRKKELDPPANSMASNASQTENVAAAPRIGCSPTTDSEPQVSRMKAAEQGCSPSQNCHYVSNYQATTCPGSQSGSFVSYRDPVDVLVRKLKCLDINGGHEDIVIQPQNALVPYVGGVGAMVPFQGPFDLIKKRKPRPKVDLDPESHRVWRLLMGKESSEGEEGAGIDKGKWWEEERHVFRGRADSFIARMHLIQGDRRFSRWKGSVVDSVIGVFLTQNVTDHLSSSAFMSLAARFPPQSKWNTKAAKIETISRHIVGNATNRRQRGVSHPEFRGQSSSGVSEFERRGNNEMVNSNELLESNSGGGIIGYSKESSLEVHEIELGTGRESPDSTLGTAVTVTSCMSAVEGDDRKSLEDVVSSQNSAASSQNSSECPGQTTDQSQPSPPMNFEADELLTRGWINCFSSFRELLEMADGRALHYKINRHDKIPPTDLLGPINSNTDQPISSGVGARHLQCGRHSCWQSDASSKKSVPGRCLNQKDGHAVMIQQIEKGAELQMERTRKSVESQTEFFYNFGPHRTCSNSDNNNHRNEKFAEGTAEANLRNEISTSEKVSAETSNGASKSKKVKAENDKKIFDWDSLRRHVFQNDAKKERSSDTMDSLDYEALRNADVGEIAHAIRERGMNNLLAERIKDFLNRLVRDHGSIDLEWLRDIPPDKAKDYLLSIRGLGLKSVECVRLLTLHHLAFPVDTNVGRICVRLGWVPLQPLPESLQLHLLEMYPVLETIQKYLWPRLCTLDQRTLYELHYQLITFGKVFCTKSKPNCNACPMRGECKHFASAFASARLALPGPEEKHLVSVEVPLSSERSHSLASISVSLPQLEGSTLSTEQIVPRNCEPIIEEPATPEPKCIEASEIDIEDAFYNDPDEIPTIKLNFEEFTQNLHNYMQENNLGLQDGDMSKALVAISAEAASIPMPKLKNVNRLRTEHQVYELPDTHPLLEGLDTREPDDPCPYLLAIWTPGETAQSTEPPTECCDSNGTGKMCDKNTCFRCNSIREAQSQIVRGTLLIPCRTANRGSFPLNGTYFQVNEVFADHDSSLNPVDVPRDWIWNLPRRTVYFGSSVTSIFKGLTTEGIQHCFWRGFLCVRGFDRTSRAPRPLFARLHFPASRVTRNRKEAAAAVAREE